jgi:restriction system protein
MESHLSVPGDGRRYFAQSIDGTSDEQVLRMFEAVKDITPSEFELLVKQWFEAQSESIDSFDSQHRELLAGADGEFEIDVSIRFKMFGGAQFHILVECKKHKNAIKRDIVQVLNDRLRSTGAHKGFVFATASFQSGALRYAKKNGIALVQIASGRTTYIQATDGEPPPLPPSVPRYVGWHLEHNDEGNIELELVGHNDLDHLTRLVKSAKYQTVARADWK